ncbi:unnamed protein product, partial [Thlaspi arvense]
FPLDFHEETWLNLLSSLAAGGLESGLSFTLNTKTKMGKSKREDLNQFLIAHLNTIYDTLQLFDRTASPTEEKVNWSDVLQMSDHLSKQATIEGSYEKDKKPSIPQLSGAVWETCSSFKKVPATNIIAIGRGITQVAVSMKDVLREMKEVKPACPSPECEADEDDNSHDDDDLGSDLSPEEMEVAQMVAEIVSEMIMVIKELIRVITGMIKLENPKDNGGFVDSLEKLLKLCEGNGVQIDELGACVYPPQEMNKMQQAVKIIQRNLDEAEAEVERLRSSSDAFSGACRKLRNSMKHMETELDKRCEAEVVVEMQNVTLVNLAVVSKNLPNLKKWYNGFGPNENRIADWITIEPVRPPGDDRRRPREGREMALGFVETSRSFFYTSTANTSLSVSKRRFLFQSPNLPPHPSSSSSSPTSSNLESYFANLILTSYGCTPNRKWSSHQFRLLLADPDLLIRVLNMIREKPEIAYHFFKWLQHQRDVKQSLQAFAAVLEILAENDLMSKAYWVAGRSIDLGMHEIDDLLIDGAFDKRIARKLLDLLLLVYTRKSMAEQCFSSFEKMIRRRFLPSVRNCNILLRVLRDNRMMDKAQEVYRAMVEHGIEPTVVTVNTMLDSCLKAGDLEQASEILSEMESKVVPTVITFNTMLDSCFKSGDLQQVHKIMSEMKRRKVKATEVTYNILINGFYKNGKMEEARRFHGDMRRSGFPVTAYSFNLVIEGYCRQGLLDEAWGVIKHMLNAGVSPTASTYNIYIRALCEFRSIEDARRLLLDMGAPDVVSYNTLMHGYVKAGKIAEAFLLFGELRDRNISPSVVTYNTLMDGLCESGNLEPAQRLKEEMVSQNIYPDVKTYTTLVKGFVKNGNLAMATAVYDEMLGKGIRPDRYAYTTRIVGELQLGDSDKAFRLQEEMVAKDHYSRDLITYNVCIDGLYKVGNLEKAIEFQRKIYSDGLVPDHVTYTTVMRAYLEKGRFKMAKVLYQEMLRKKLSPSVITYFVLIHGHAKVGRLQQAFQYSTEMKKRGVRPNVMTCNALLHGICKAGEVDEAHRYFCKMEEEGIPPNRYSYTMLINKNSDLGRWEEVIKLYKEMLDKEIEPDAYTHWALFKHLDKDHRSREVEFLEKLLRRETHSELWPESNPIVVEAPFTCSLARFLPASMAITYYTAEARRIGIKMTRINGVCKISLTLKSMALDSSGKQSEQQQPRVSPETGDAGLRLRRTPNEEHQPENYEDLQLDFSPALFSSLERYLPEKLLSYPRIEKAGFMRDLLLRYSPDTERIRIQRHREYREKILSTFQRRHVEIYSLDPASFFAPSFLEAVNHKSEEGFRSIVVQQAPGIFTFPMFNPQFCESLLAEVEHMEKWVYESKATIMRPNTLNRFGLVLDDFGFESMLQKLVDDFISPLSQVLFPEVCGSSLDSHHGFIVEYGRDRDVDLGFHVDDSEVSLNVCLGKQFAGGELYFRGVRCDDHVNSESTQEEVYDYSHVPGQAILHRGRHRHGARATTAGHRVNLILWCRSSTFREMKNYQREFPSWCGGCKADRQKRMQASIKATTEELKKRVAGKVLAELAPRSSAD